MNQDAPRKCAERGTSLPRRRFAHILTLAGLTLLSPVLAAAEGDPWRSDPAPAERGGGGLDPRGEEAQLRDIEPAPAGRWVALRSVQRRPYQLGLWFVDLESGQFRPWEQAEPTGAPMVWRDGRLRTEVHTAGRRQFVSIDPESGTFEPSERGGELESGWSHTVITRRSGGLRVLTIEWPELSASFELPGGPESEYRLTEAPGVVFYTELDHGALRVLRHDMRTQRTAEVVSIGGEQPSWSPSPDGQLVVVGDDYRTHMVAAVNGETVSGPWPTGRATWLDQGGHEHLMLTTGGHRYVLDVYGERRIHLGPEEGPEPEVHVLANGTILVLAGEQLDYLDEDGELIQNLIPGRPRLETAGR